MDLISTLEEGMKRTVKSGQSSGNNGGQQKEEGEELGRWTILTFTISHFERNWNFVGPIQFKQKR